MSPTISEFNGLRITIHAKESQHAGRAHIHVGPKTNPRQATLSVPELDLLAGSPLTSSHMNSLKSWMKMLFPEQQRNGVWVSVVVGDRLLEDWMTIQNGQMPSKPNTSNPIRNLIPTPEEIKKLKSPVKPKQSSFYDRAQILKVAVVKDRLFHLDAEFADGLKKRIDVTAMYENSKIHPFYKRHLGSQEIFSQVHFDKYAVWWGEAGSGEESEIEHTDLYSAGREN
jgi:hypothetical protein